YGPPPEAVRGLLRARVRFDGSREVLQIRGVPHPIAGDLDELGFHRQRLSMRLDPFAERTPHLARLLRAHSLEGQRQVERVVPPDPDLLAPMLVAQSLAIEEEEAFGQLRERGVVPRDDAGV